MTTLMKRIGVPAAALIVAAFALTACSDEQPGQAQPAGVTNPGSSGSAGSSAPSDAVGSSSSLQGTDPCSLMPADAASQLQLGQGQKTKDDAEGAVCEFNGGNYTLTVLALYAKPFDAEVAGNVITPVTINGGSHQAVQRKATGGLCSISMAVTASSSVDVEGDFGSGQGRDADQACQLAKLGAQAVEPNLPKN